MNGSVGYLPECFEDGVVGISGRELCLRPLTYELIIIDFRDSWNEKKRAIFVLVFGVEIHNKYYRGTLVK